MLKPVWTHKQWMYYTQNSQRLRIRCNIGFKEHVLGKTIPIQIKTSINNPIDTTKWLQEIFPGHQELIENPFSYVKYNLSPVINKPAPTYETTHYRWLIIWNFIMQTLQDTPDRQKESRHSPSGKNQSILQAIKYHTEERKAPPFWKSFLNFFQSKEWPQNKQNCTIPNRNYTVRSKILGGTITCIISYPVTT